MPRLANSANSSFYHYLVKRFNDDQQTELEEERFCRTQKEIFNIYGLNRSAIYYCLKPVEGRTKRKYKNFAIEKVLRPVFQQTELLPGGIVPHQIPAQ